MSEITPEPIQTTHPRLTRRRPTIPWMALLAIFSLFLGLGAGYLIWGTQSTAAAESAPAESQAQIQIPEKVTRYDVPVDDDPTYGPADAPITIVEFSDYECPFCTRWHEEVWLRLREEYPTQVRLVYRDFPLPGHPNALSAAVAANCAGEQGQYFAYHDLLFGAAQGLGDQAYLEYAQELGLDLEQFKTCLTSGKYDQEIQADASWASNLGVSSTPTFFINGIPMIGAQPYNVFKQVIDLELAGKIPQE